MPHHCPALCAALIAAVALTGLGPNPAEATHDQPARAEAPKKPVVTSRQPPVKRQNFRARSTDEIPPWEGFEDCPAGIPCVGMMAPVPPPRRR